jgi:hypothetical protein
MGDKRGEKGDNTQLQLDCPNVESSNSKVGAGLGCRGLKRCHLCDDPFFWGVWAWMARETTSFSLPGTRYECADQSVSVLRSRGLVTEQSEL